MKTAFFYLSVWLISVIGPGDWKFCSRQVFNSWQFAAQAEKWCWAGNCKYLLFKIEDICLKLATQMQF